MSEEEDSQRRYGPNRTDADRARNFRESLDRDRERQRRGLAGGGNTASKIGQVHEIKASPSLPRPPRQYEYEHRLAQMEATIRRLTSDIRKMQDPFREVFLANRTGSGSNGGQWQERTVQGTNIVDFQDGRKCDSGTASGQLLTLGANVALLEINTGSNRSYVPISGNSSGTGVFVRVSGGATGAAIYTGALCTGGAQKSFTDDSATTYTDGTPINNGDYALNLSDNIVYHRVTGTWVSAAGHVTDKDVDPDTDFSDQISSVFVDVPGSSVLIVNLFEAQNPWASEIIQRPQDGEVFEAAYLRTNADGTDVYSIDTGLRLGALTDGEPGQGVYWNGTSLKYQFDWLRAVSVG